MRTANGQESAETILKELKAYHEKQNSSLNCYENIQSWQDVTEKHRVLHGEDISENLQKARPGFQNESQ